MMATAASPAQVSNDLDAQARRLEKTGNDQLVVSLKRGAATIRALMKVNFALEKAAQDEADRLERYQQGHGA